jgi:soluble lytic murein transglycosylase-like protein
MASIYESAGPQVALTGSQTAPNFQPGQAYDPSRIMAQQSEKDLQAFSQFSTSLTSYLKDQAEADNKANYEIGLSGNIADNIQPSEEQVAEHNNTRNGLEATAIKDGMVADAVGTESDAFFNKKIVSSLAKNEWQRYGQAVRMAKDAAASSSGFLSQSMTDDKPIQIMQADGTIKTIIPSQIRDPQEWEAAFRQNVKNYVRSTGLSIVNPIILAKEFSPTVSAVKTQLFSARMAAARKEFQEEAQEQNKITIYEEAPFLNPSDPKGLADYFQKTSASMVIGTGLRRGEANAETIKHITESLIGQGRTDLLDAFKKVPLIANQPNGITIGEFYNKSFVDARATITARNKADEAEVEADYKKVVEGIESERTIGLLNNPGDATNINSAAKGALRSIINNSGGSNKLAVDALLKLESTDGAYSAVNAPKYKELLRKDPTALSTSELEQVFVSGQINATEYVDLKKMMPEDRVTEDLKSYQPDLKKRLQAALVLKHKQLLKEGGVFTATAESNLFATAVISGLSEVNDALKRAKIANPNLTEKEMLDLTEVKIKEMMDRPNSPYEFKIEGNGRITHMNPYADPTTSKFRPESYVSPRSGRVSHDFTRLSGSALATATSRPNEDTLLTAPELKLAEQQLATGQKPGGRILEVMKATGLSHDQLVTAQRSAHNAPATVTAPPKATQATRLQFLRAPGAAAILSNPNASSIQKIRAWADFGIAQERYARRQAERKAAASATSAPDMAPGSTATMADYVRLGLSNGLNKEDAIKFAAIGMAESTGQSGVVNATPAYGLWQINMAGAMGPDRIKRYGLRSAEDLKDPETNARVAAQMFKSEGFGPWEAYTDGRYRQYLSDARQALYSLQSSNFSGARGGRANFAPTNVQSIRIETPGNSFQPGMDLWFADKNFGAVLPGRVKEIRPNNGNYGNTVIVESVDPETGDKLDVLYAHLDTINVRPGDSILPGSIIGRQGGTGRVKSQDGTIASIDFYAPAEVGSNSKKPYARWKQLATRIEKRIKSSQF